MQKIKYFFFSKCWISSGETNQDKVNWIDGSFTLTENDTKKVTVVDGNPLIIEAIDIHCYPLSVSVGPGLGRCGYTITAVHKCSGITWWRN